MSSASVTPFTGPVNLGAVDVSRLRRFEIFEDRRLALVYQDQISDGAERNFNRFVSRD